MKRTKLDERQLPNYTHGEELANMISHIVGGGLGVLTLTACLIVSIAHRSPWGIVSSAIYGLSYIQLYSISSIYHGLKAGRAKKVMQVLDHCSIYLFIAGSYTPILLCLLRPSYPGWAWALFGVVWALAALGISLNAVDLKKYRVFSMICYIGMGWCIVIGIHPMLDVMARSGLVLLVTGGIAYTLGAVLYGIGSKRHYVHSIFHIFVVAGSVLQALCILLYVL